MYKTSKKSNTSSKKLYDYLIVGAGLFGSTFARKMHDSGKKVLVIDKRDHVGGNCASYKTAEGIDVHMYGAHIFHTDEEIVWQFVNRFTNLNNFINTPIANFNGKLYPLPFNMFTFNALWGTITPDEAAAKLNIEREPFAKIKNPKNLEEKALTLVGEEIYEKLIKGYTTKQWGRDPKDLPSSIINRLPFRLEYNNNYFSDKYQGIPSGGYGDLFKNMLKGIEVKLSTDFFADRSKLEALAERIVFTGCIDQYFDYQFGELEYRSLRFENIELKSQNHQGVAVMNYTDAVTPYTRIIEHKHFRQEDKSYRADTTIITKEYPASYAKGSEPYYVINDQKNTELYAKYKVLADKEAADSGTIFGGRLAEYRYYDMDDAILSALNSSDKIAKNKHK